MDESPIPAEIIDAMAQKKPGARLDFAAAVIEYLLGRYPSDDAERRLAEMALKVLREDALGAVLAAREPRPAEPKVDHFPSVERRGLIKTLGLRFGVVKGQGDRDLFVVSADVPDVETGRDSSFSPARWREPGESDDAALRAAILKFFEHETDHGLWRDGEHIRDPDATEDPHSL